MNPEALAEALRRGGLTGAFCNFASYGCVEAMTLTGYDFLVLDMQHGEITQGSFPALLGAFGRAGAPWPVVRAASNDYHLINWLFDMGVPGVLVPMVNSVADARRAVDAAKYPPVGRRSFGPTRAAAWGSALATYIPRADAASTLIVQIEDAEAARDIDSILAVPGIDAVFMGPNDLALSMLQPGDTIRGNPAEWSAFARTPEVLGLCEHVMRRCNNAGIPFGMTATSLTDAQDWFARGASLVSFGSDFAFLRAGAQTVRQQAGDSRS